MLSATAFSMRRLVVLAMTLGLAGCDRCDRSAGSTPGTGATGGARAARLVILGFDGVDPRWLERWAEQGKLPHVSRLMREGGYRHLTTTHPPQSPVAWTSFATGTWPGEHGIFDFIGRRLVTTSGGLPVVPEIATSRIEPQPVGPPVATSLRHGEPFWQTLGNDGVRVVAINVPYSFPPDPMRHGRMLSGLGTPDLRETNSTFTYAGTDVSEERARRPPGGGVLVPLRLEAGRARFDLEGPTVVGANGEPAGRMRCPVELVVGPEPGEATLVVGSRRLPLRAGEMTELLELTFEAEGKRPVRGIARFLLLEARPPATLRLFVSPVSIHPREPYLPIGFPDWPEARFSAQLADAIGSLYKTVGWDHDTSALTAEVIDDTTFLRDVDDVERHRRAMLEAMLGRDDWDLLIWVSTAPDRVAHMFYRLIDPHHPRHDASAAARHGDAIEREYVRMDETLGRVLERLRPTDVLLVLSDHGFHNYRRGLHVNQWLRQQGLLALRADATHSSRELLLDVDWSRTRAYALGTGQIYLNLRGRERDGIVPPEEVPALLARIRDGLLALRDAEREDARVVEDVLIGSEIFRGARASGAPDLQLAFTDGYRTSWETILGGIPEGLFADNTKKWSGDHAASDARRTPGILLSNRALRDAVAIVDLAPTALAFFGRSIPPRYVGRSVLIDARTGAP
ncbi:MAG: alkaline phosphatase family protein [Myxococcota bacterium]|nr:alkaline phosphatase family protein [Myxococcota bacterium]MDW8360900.1 alkaline phosphatase family protein [Myxococcales bacterium]